MIRFLMKMKKKLPCGAETETFYTIDTEVPVLERMLMSGGFSETEYEHHALIGCEVKEIGGLP